MANDKIKQMIKEEKKKKVFASYKTSAEYKSMGREAKKKNNSFVGLPHCFLMDKVILSLKPTTFRILVYMYDYSNGEQEFTFPKSIYSKITTIQTFKNAIRELKEKGIIEEIENGKFTRTENKYRFSDKWNDYQLPKKTKRKTKIIENKFKYDNENKKEK